MQQALIDEGILRPSEGDRQGQDQPDFQPDLRSAYP